MSQRIPRDLLQQAFPDMPRLWRAFEEQDATVVDQAHRLPKIEGAVEEVKAATAAAQDAADAAQTASPILTALAAVPQFSGVIEQIQTGFFGIRPVDQPDKASLLTRGLADTRYARTASSTPTPPTSSTSAGTAGTTTYDSNFFYVCVATNTWRRTALSTF